MKIKLIFLQQLRVFRNLPTLDNYNENELLINLNSSIIICTYLELTINKSSSFLKLSSRVITKSSFTGLHTCEQVRCEYYWNISLNKYLLHLRRMLIFCNNRTFNMYCWVMLCNCFLFTILVSMFVVKFHLAAYIFK